jgi:hypothetical protein
MLLKSLLQWEVLCKRPNLLKREVRDPDHHHQYHDHDHHDHDHHEQLSTLTTVQPYLSLSLGPNLLQRHLRQVQRYLSLSLGPNLLQHRLHSHLSLWPDLLQFKYTVLSGGQNLHRHLLY